MFLYFSKNLINYFNAKTKESVKVYLVPALYSMKNTNSLL